MYKISKNVPLYLAFFIYLVKDVAATTVECRHLDIDQVRQISETEDPGKEIFKKQPTSGSVSFSVTSLPTPEILSYFRLEANDNVTALFSNKTLDLEELYKLGLRITNLQISTTCTDAAPVTYTTTLVIEPVNEYPPHFIGEPFNVSIGEDTTVNDIVYSLEEKTDDADFDGQPAKIIYFYIHPFDEQSVDGEQYFHVSGDIRKGKIALTKELDFESLAENGQTYFMVNVSASVVSPIGTSASRSFKCWVTTYDLEAKNDDGNLMTTTTVNISVYDTDDLGPAFTLPGCKNTHTPTCSGYSSGIDYTYTGPLQILPIAIEAVDMDTLGSVIIYSISLVTPPKYKDNLSIDSKSGAITVTAPLLDASTNVFIYLEATEDTPLQNSSMAYVVLTVRTPGGTTLIPPDGPTNVGQDTEKAPISWTIFGVVLGVCLILIIIVGIVTFCVSKRFRTPIFPGTSDSEKNVSHDEIHSQTATWPPSRTNSKQELIRNEYLTPISSGKATQLAPISHEVTKRKSRKKKKNRPPEIFDGTRTYEGKADPEFYEDGNKRKIKRSPRSYENQDPKYWIKVPNNN